MKTFLKVHLALLKIKKWFIYHCQVVTNTIKKISIYFLLSLLAIAVFAYLIICIAERFSYLINNDEFLKSILWIILAIFIYSPFSFAFNYILLRYIKDEGIIIIIECFLKS